MALNIVAHPYQYFGDPDAGRPIAGGEVYVGIVDLDPTIPANQKSVTLRQEDGTEVSVSQPIDLSAGGYPTYQGSPVAILVDGDYSLAVLDSIGVQKFYSASSPIAFLLTRANTVAVVDTVSDLTASSFEAGITVDTRGYYSASGQGGARYLIQSAADFGGTPDGYGDHTLANGNVAVLQDNEDVANIRKFGAADATESTSAVQAAIDSGASWIAWTCSPVISGSLTPVEGQIHMGKGKGNTVIDGASLAAGTPAFLWETANGSTDRDGITIARMTINAKSGIRINNSANGFTDSATSQENILGCVFQDLEINGQDKSGNGIECSKCFELDISRCWIYQNDYPIRLHGCDTGKVHHNRLQSAGTACYREEGYSTFGNNITVEDNFMANLADGGIAHIMSSNRSIRIFRNQIEQTTVPTPLLAGAIQIFNNGSVDVVQEVQLHFNQLLVDSTTCTNLIDFDTVEWQYLSCIRNGSIKGSSPTARFNGDVTYWYNSVYRRIIDVQGNDFIRPPFNTSHRPVDRTNGYEFSPSTPGMSPGNQGVSTVVEGGAFKLPPVASAGHIVVFDPARTTYGQHGGIATYTLLAKGSVDGQILTYQLMDGAAVRVTSTITLNTHWTEYTLFFGDDDAGAITDKQIRLFNQDTTNNGDVFVRRVSIDVDFDKQTQLTADLNSATSRVNVNGKYVGKMVYNTDTNKPVWADGSGATSVWVDATGATVHTPV